MLSPSFGMMRDVSDRDRQLAGAAPLDAVRDLADAHTAEREPGELPQLLLLLGGESEQAQPQQHAPQPVPAVLKAEIGGKVVVRARVECGRLLLCHGRSFLEMADRMAVPSPAGAIRQLRHGVRDTQGALQGASGRKACVSATGPPAGRASRAPPPSVAPPWWRNWSRYSPTSPSSRSDWPAARSAPAGRG
jgi:hypothetical protein